MANPKLVALPAMTVFSRAMTALCGPAQPDVRDFREVLASAGLRANVFVPDVPHLDRRSIRACEFAAKQGYVLTDPQGNLRGRLVPLDSSPVRDVLGVSTPSATLAHP